MVHRGGAFLAGKMFHSLLAGRTESRTNRLKAKGFIYSISWERQCLTTYLDSIIGYYLTDTTSQWVGNGKALDLVFLAFILLLIASNDSCLVSMIFCSAKHLAQYSSVFEKYNQLTYLVSKTILMPNFKVGFFTHSILLIIGDLGLFLQKLQSCFYGLNSATSKSLGLFSMFRKLFVLFAQFLKFFNALCFYLVE